MIDRLLSCNFLPLPSPISILTSDLFKYTLNGTAVYPFVSNCCFIFNIYFLFNNNVLDLVGSNNSPLARGDM